MRALDLYALAAFASACAQGTGAGVGHWPPDDGTERRSQAIIGGAPVSSDRRPSEAVVALLAVGQGEGFVWGGFACSGTVIAPNAVLTAAHCVRSIGDDEELYVTASPDVRDFGVDGLALPDDSIRVQHISAHPRFDETSRTNGALGVSFDLAVLILDAPFPDLVPVRLARPEHAAFLVPGTPVTIAGYGHHDPDPEVDSTGLLNSGDSILRAVGDSELLVGGAPGGADKCYGDSGGPTFMEVDGTNRLVGVTSRDLGDETSCRLPGVDVRVDIFADWIDAELTQVASEAQRHSGPQGCQTTPGRASAPWAIAAMVVLGRLWRRDRSTRGRPGRP